MPINRVATVCVFVSDQERAKDFYTHRVRLSSVERVPQIFTSLNAKYGVPQVSPFFSFLF